MDSCVLRVHPNKRMFATRPGVFAAHASAPHPHPGRRSPRARPRRKRTPPCACAAAVQAKPPDSAQRGAPRPGGPSRGSAGVAAPWPPREWRGRAVGGLGRSVILTWFRWLWIWEERATPAPAPDDPSAGPCPAWLPPPPQRWRQHWPRVSQGPCGHRTGGRLRAPGLTGHWVRA